MKKILGSLLALLFIASVAIAGPTGPFPNKEFGQDLGKDGRSYNHLYIGDQIIFEGATSDAYEGILTCVDPTADRTWTLPNKSGTVAMTSDVSTAAPAINAVTGAEADVTIAFTAYQGLFTSTLTNKDMFTFRGLGNFGDVSVVKIESLTGNPTDGTVLEVVAHDADVDPLVVSSSAQAGVLKVNGDGTVAIIGATGITGATTVTGSFGTTGATTLGNASSTVAVNSSDWKISTVGDMTGIGAITADGLITGTLGATITGAAVNLNASSNFATNIGTGSSNGAISIGGGSNTLTINTSDWDISATGDMTGIGAITSDGLLTAALGATISGATINLNADSNFAVNIGTGTSTGTVTIGGTGTQAIDIGDGAGAKTVHVGSSNTTSTTNILSGSNGVNINVSGDDPVNIATGTATGTVTIGGTGTQQIDVGNGAGVKTVNVGSANTTSPTTIYSGTSAGPLTINKANGTATTEIATGNTSGAVTIGGGSNTVEVASTTWDVSTAGAFTGVTGLTFAPNVAHTITQATNGAGQDLTISVTGAQNASLALASAGTAADAFNVATTAGGMLFTASGAMADQFKVSAVGTIAGNAINLVTTDGGIVLTAGGAANGDITLTAGDALTETVTGNYAMNATGTAAITSSDWGISTTGAMTKIASVGFDSGSVIYVDSVTCDSACIKGLRAAPKALVAAPGSGKFIEFVSAVLIMDYAGAAYTESSDDLIIRYHTSNVAASGAIDSTGLLTATADTTMFVPAVAIVATASTSFDNLALELFNTGDGEFAGAGTGSLIVKVSYKVHTFTTP